MSENFGNFITMFQGGLARTLIISATAGDVITDLTPGAGKRWLILYGKITLINEASAGNRNIYFLFTDAANNVLMTSLASANIAISATSSLHIGISNAAGITGAISLAGTYIALGSNAYVDGTNKIRVVISSGVAGDSYSGRIKVLEI